MSWRDSRFMIHTCTIQRPTIVDVTNIRDRKISAYATVESGVACWFEHHGASLVRDDMIGRVGVNRYSVWFEGVVDVRINDRLLKDGVYYEVEDVSNFNDERFHKVAIARQKSYATS